VTINDNPICIHLVVALVVHTSPARNHNHPHSRRRTFEALHCVWMCSLTYCGWCLRSTK